MHAGRVAMLLRGPWSGTCRFYDKAHKLDVLDFFKAQAVHPDALPGRRLQVHRCAMGIPTAYQPSPSDGH